MDDATPRNPEHDFALLLSGVPGINEEVADALYEAGCDDALLSLQRGAYILDFCRAAPSLKEAIISAIRDLQGNRLGIDVIRVNTCEYVNQAEIAEKIGVTRATINLYVAGKRGPGGFPPPVCHITDGHPSWAWCEVASWLERNQLLDHQQVVDARDVRNINMILECRNSFLRDREQFQAVLNELWHVDLSKSVTSR